MRGMLAAAILATTMIGGGANAQAPDPAVAHADYSNPALWLCRPRRHSQCGQLYCMMGDVARWGVGYSIVEGKRPYPRRKVEIRPFPIRDK